MQPQVLHCKTADADGHAPHVVKILTIVAVATFRRVGRFVLQQHVGNVGAIEVEDLPAQPSRPREVFGDEATVRFGQFDVVCEEEGLEKVKTIGDSYMAVAGVPREVSDHAVRAARAALRMRDLAAEAFVARSKGLGPYELGIRIGLHSGPLVSGVLNRSKVAFDLWGDTVNIASRMESQGLINEIQLTGATLERLQPEFGTQSRGDMEVRGIGRMQTWLLEPGAVVVPAPTSSRVPEVPGPSTG